MDARGVVVFELDKNNRKYSLFIPIGTPYGEAHDALYEMINNLLELAKQQAQKAQESQKGDEQQSSIEEGNGEK